MRNLHTFELSKVYSDISELQKVKNKSIVLTNGCFDIIHAGHIKFLKECKNMGDILVVAINSDTSVARNKGNLRPINSLASRSEILSAIRSVDYVIPFEEDNASQIVQQIKPDIYIKGSDYVIPTTPEGKVVLSYGGRIEEVPIIEGHSTTAIIKKITKLYKE